MRPAPQIAVVDSGVANLASVMAALRRIGAEAEVTDDPERIRKAGRVILPGVGAAGAAMAQLGRKNLRETLSALTQPVLGICLGMQLLFARSFEGKGEPIQCLGVLSGDIRAIPAGRGTPVPHMGWNRLRPLKEEHPLLRGIAPGDYAYFVHSYAAAIDEAAIAAADYGISFAAMAGTRNFFGCQFHPERSGAVGRRILENFAGM